MDQAVMVFAGTAARASALPTPEVGMTAYSTATGLQVYDGSAWVNVGNDYGVATGGNGTSTATISGTNYRILEFTATGSLVISTAGRFDIGAVMGGGGGIAGNAGFPDLANGGAGGGGWFQESINLAAGTVTITVGAGGAVGAAGNASGLSTRLFRIGGAPAQDGAVQTFGICGCGSTRQVGTGGLNFGDFLGRVGGTGPTGNTNLSAGGGGGAGGVGGTGSGGTGGNGGAGYDVSAFIGGSARLLGGGGGSCGRTTGGTGTNGGGNGASVAGAGTNGTANTGGGAGSSIGSGAGATGGSGIVFVRFRV